MKTSTHQYCVCAGNKNYILSIEKPEACLVSMEYYFTYNRWARLAARPDDGSETIDSGADRFIPQAYFPELIKSAVIRLNSSKPPTVKKLNSLMEAIASSSTQFPLLVIEGKTTTESVSRIIDTLKPLVEKYNMYFLLLLRMKEVPADMDALFHAHREVFYSSRNRIFLKCLLEADTEQSTGEKMVELKKRNIAADIVITVDKKNSRPAIPDMAAMTDVWRDSYSEQDIHHGPNIWIDIKRKIPPTALLELDGMISSAGVRRLYMHPSMHRLLNGYATLKPGGIRGTLVFNMNGSLLLEDMGKKVELGSWLEDDMRALLQKQPSGDCANQATTETPCGELSAFCLRSPLHCEYLQGLIQTLAEKSE